MKKDSFEQLGRILEEDKKDIFQEGEEEDRKIYGDIIVDYPTKLEDTYILSSRPDGGKIKKAKPKIADIKMGDILTDVQVVLKAFIKNGLMEVKILKFPYVIILSQSCDIESNKISRKVGKKNHHLITALIAPLYNFDQFTNGKHLTSIYDGDKVADYSTEKGLSEKLQKDKIARYHLMDYPEGSALVQQVIDFKHFFTVDYDYLNEIYEGAFKARVSPLFREQIAQRFANYLSRIGLPDKDEDDNEITYKIKLDEVG